MDGFLCHDLSSSRSLLANRKQDAKRDLEKKDVCIKFDQMECTFILLPLSYDPIV